MFKRYGFLYTLLISNNNEKNIMLDRDVSAIENKLKDKK